MLDQLRARVSAAKVLRIAATTLERVARRVTVDPVHQAAARIGADWRQNAYYDDAEQYMTASWNELLWPFLSDCDFSVVLDLATGHGRNAVKLAEHAQKLYLVDINVENIDFCRNRFAGDPRFEFVVCSGTNLDAIPSRSVSLVYCFDAMVHFDSDTVRSYIAEFARVLRPGGRGFCHHSNYTANPTAFYHDNPHWRNFMSRELFEHWCHKEGLRVVRSRVIDWGVDNAKALDCLTLFERPR